MNELVLSVVVGSHAYGLAIPESDVDRRGVFSAPAQDFWRFDKPATSFTGPREEELNWELEHFCHLALRSNPTVLDTLVSDQVEVCTPLGGELRALLPHFLSRRAAASYLKATWAQLTRAEAGTEIKWKQVMHVIRLLRVCRDLLRTGTLRIRSDEHRDALLAVRFGEVPWPEAQEWARRLRAEIEEAERDSPLPVSPDRDAVERWLVSVRRRDVVGEPA